MRDLGPISSEPRQRARSHFVVETNGTTTAVYVDRRAELRALALDLVALLVLVIVLLHGEESQ
jgi:hypothetical protein